MIKSNYLQKEIELKTAVATGTGSRKCTIVFHSDLEDFILNKMEDEYVSWHFVVNSAETKHPVVTCSLYSNKRGCDAIGEVDASMLKSSVERNFPVTIASNRAFDRAVIRFLGLGPNVYSNSEMEPDGPRTIPATNLTDGDSNAPVNINTPSQDKMEELNKNNELKKCGDVIISIGRYKDSGKTIAEICAENRQWLEYVTTAIKPNNPSAVKQVEAAKAYLRMTEVHANVAK